MPSAPSRGNLLESTTADPSHQCLDNLVQSHLEIVSRKAQQATETTMGPCNSKKTLVHDLGEYLVLAAQNWSEVTSGLVNSGHINEVVIDAHENSRSTTRFTDLSAVVVLDIECAKLRNIRDLTEKFSSDMQKIWCSDSNTNKE